MADYEHRVSAAIAVIEQLQAASDDEDPSLREHFVITSVARIREELPAKETIQLNAQAIVVDNTWLHEALQDYEKTNSNRAQRADALARVEERLRALDERLKEVQSGKPAASDKDGDKGKLAEILRRPDYNKPVSEEGSALGRLWNRFVRWLFSLFRVSKPMTRAPSPFLSGLIQVVLVVACLVGIALLIWKLGPRYFRNRLGRKKQKREARIDLRAAIRKAYIALLCELGDRKIVSLAQHKTNRDYLNSVRERGRLYSSLRQLTTSFELHWYGFQPVAVSDWNEFRAGYQQALKAGS